MNDPQPEGSHGKLHRTTEILSRTRRCSRVAALRAGAAAGNAGGSSHQRHGNEFISSSRLTPVVGGSMGAEQSKPKGPDLARGMPLDDVADGGMVSGHVGDDTVLLARRGDELFAIGATCSHYGGPLAEGLIVGDTVRCPWHHACFSLRTGEAVAAPAFNPMPCWRVEKRNGMLFVREKIEPTCRRAAGA